MKLLNNKKQLLSLIIVLMLITAIGADFLEDSRHLEYDVPPTTAYCNVVEEGILAIEKLENHFAYTRRDTNWPMGWATTHDYQVNRDFHIRFCDDLTIRNNGNSCLTIKESRLSFEECIANPKPNHF